MHVAIHFFTPSETVSDLKLFIPLLNPILLVNLHIVSVKEIELMFGGPQRSTCISVTILNLIVVGIKSISIGNISPLLLVLKPILAITSLPIGHLVSIQSFSRNFMYNSF